MCLSAFSVSACSLLAFSVCVFMYRFMVLFYVQVYVFVYKELNINLYYYIRHVIHPRLKSIKIFMKRVTSRLKSKG